jgi:hypothetical protein
VTRAYYNESIKVFEQRGLHPEHIELNRMQALILREPSGEDEPTKDTPQGYDIFLIGDKSKIILIRKWSRGDIDYEKVVAAFLQTLNPEIFVR